MFSSLQSLAFQQIVSLVFQVAQPVGAVPYGAPYGTPYGAPGIQPAAYPAGVATQPPAGYGYGAPGQYAPGPYPQAYPAQAPGQVIRTGQRMPK